jgi:DtxR family transcriptional regulator, Mn-dependent transcriptional regulator
MIEISPVLALSLFLLLIFLILVIIWPKIGLYSRFKKSAMDTKKILMEDALKHLYDYEYHKLIATLNSIAGNLGISVDKSSKIVESLKKAKLATLDNQSISLTSDGRSYALRVIRVHRLWENYLAEETGVKEIDWHDEAEKVEHHLSQEEADLLSAKMGNPKYDPHGDPIPATDGTFFINKGKLLNTIEEGFVAKILHVEDEPKVIYTQLVEQGFYPGKEILILKKSADKIVIAADGEERELTPLIASKVSVEILPDKEFLNEKVKTLIDLKPGDDAVVINVSPTCRGQQRRRLLDFGIVPGTNISIHMNSPLQDPVAYLVKDTIVALRKNQARKVLIKI